MAKLHDGSFDLFYRRGWAYLAVTPPEPGGRPVYHEDVLSRMKILGVPHVAVEQIRQIVQQADGVPVQLIAWPDGERLASTLTVEVSDDGMQARLIMSVPRKGAAAPDVEDIQAALANAGVVHGIQTASIRLLAQQPRYEEAALVAAGTVPVHARSAEIRYHFDPYRGKPYLVMEFDRINLRELNFIENKYQGDVLAELIPPVTPKDGMTVFGRPVPSDTQTKPIELRAGPNTEKSENGLRITATADGNVRLVRGVVMVEPVVTVERVGYETGNIRFEGSVVVEKDIADGFVIEADGDVQVGRGVGRATIRAGGSILLKAGVNGGGAATLSCEGDFFAKYVEGATVTTHGNVLVEEAIMHSHAVAWKHCLLNGRRSEIIASTLIVGGSLWCKKLGSVAEARVHVSVGLDPEVIARFRAARTEKENAESRRDQVEQEFVRVERALAEGRSDERLVTAREQLYTEMRELDRAMPELRQRVHELRDYLRASRGSRLVVEDTIFSGAVALFGTQEYHAPEKGARRTVLRPGPEGIIEEGYNPAERPVLEFDV